MASVRSKTVRRTVKKTAGGAVNKSAGKPALKKTALPTLRLDVQHAVSRDGVPSAKRLSLWAQAAYEVHHAAHAMHAGKGRRRAVPPVQVSLRIVGAAESRKLNRQWRDEDHATNVLSFPAGEMPEVAGEAPSLGDLAVCVPIVRREAREQGITLDAHWAHMMIHGVLHLLGYDHEDDRDAQVMEACEVAILERFGFANPYESA